MDIVFQVKKLRYLEIKNGKSTVEYREAKPYWTKRVQQMTGFKNWDKESELGFNVFIDEKSPTSKVVG